MLALHWRTARIVWTVLIFALLVIILYRIKGVLMVFTAAVLLAYLLSPIVNWGERLIPHRFARPMSLAVTYMMGLFLGGVALGTLGSEVARQAAVLGGRIQGYVAEYRAYPQLPLPAWLEPLREELTGFAQAQLETLAERAGPVLQSAGPTMFAVFSSLVYVVLVPILSFFFLKDGAALRDHLLISLRGAPERQAVATDILAGLHILLGEYMRALVVLAMATFAFYSLFFGLFGMPYFLLLATLAAVLEFIPVLGPLVAATAIIGVAALTGFGGILIIVLFLIAYRLFLDYVLMPLVMGRGLQLHPLLVIFGVFAGEELGGVPGMFLAIPAMAALRVIFLRLATPGGVRPAVMAEIP